MMADQRTFGGQPTGLSLSLDPSPSARERDPGRGFSGVTTPPRPRYTNDIQPLEPEETFMLSVGDVVPALTLPHVDGGDFALESLRGKRALLFWWGSW